MDFRLITATAQDLGSLAASGKFREDLFYRLNVVLISLPPLRERREDIPLLVQRFLSRSEKPLTVRQDALDRIMSYDWPGNVREWRMSSLVASSWRPAGQSRRNVFSFRKGDRRRMDVGWTTCRYGKAIGT